MGHALLPRALTTQMCLADGATLAGLWSADPPAHAVVAVCSSLASEAHPCLWPALMDGLHALVTSACGLCAPGLEGSVTVLCLLLLGLTTEVAAGLSFCVRRSICTGGGCPWGLACSLMWTQHMCKKDMCRIQAAGLEGSGACLGIQKL